MQILVIYETGEGQTHRIIDFAATQFRAEGHEVVIHNTAETTPLPDLATIDKILLAAPVHERRHPAAFEALLSAQQPALSGKDTLLLSVSLKAAFPDGIEEAREYLIEMEMRTNFTPSAELLVAGAVRSKSYDYFQKQVVKNIALRGHDVTLENGTREFTDWAALSTNLADFTRG